MFKKIIFLLTTISFLSTSALPLSAQQLVLPQAQGVFEAGSDYKPVVFRGIKIDSRSPLRLDFLVDAGDSRVSPQEMKNESEALTRYFLAALTTPARDLWVNLSPVESQSVVSDEFARTAMGRDLVAQDYILKQMTASFLHPDAEVGKVFWSEIYRKAYEKYGTTDIPMDMFNRVWIVPGQVVVNEARSSDGRNLSAFISSAQLKVLAETDYLEEKSGHVSRFVAVSPETKDSASRAISVQVLRDVVVPALEHAVNTSKSFSSLRQIYYSLLLAVWLKRKLSPSAILRTGEVSQASGLLGNVFIDKSKTDGIEIDNPQGQIRRIYERYAEAFRLGAYNLIREDQDFYSDEPIARKYFSGGASFLDADSAMEIRQGQPSESIDRASVVSVGLQRLRTFTRWTALAVVMAVSLMAVSLNADARSGAATRDLSSPTSYVVVTAHRGDTLLGLAGDHNTSVRAIKEANSNIRGIKENKLFAGKTYRIPSTTKKTPSVKGREGDRVTPKAVAEQVARATSLTERDVQSEKENQNPTEFRIRGGFLPSDVADTYNIPYEEFRKLNPNLDRHWDKEIPRGTVVRLKAPAESPAVVPGSESQEAQSSPILDNPGRVIEYNNPGRVIQYMGDVAKYYLLTPQTLRQIAQEKGWALDLLFVLNDVRSRDHLLPQGTALKVPPGYVNAQSSNSVKAPQPSVVPVERKVENYRVRKWRTLEDIARHKGWKLEDLRSLNPGVSPDQTLPRGKVLTVPAKASPAVVSGSTNSIAGIERHLERLGVLEVVQNKYNESDVLKTFFGSYENFLAFFGSTAVTESSNNIYAVNRPRNKKGYVAYGWLQLTRQTMIQYGTGEDVDTVIADIVSKRDGHVPFIVSTAMSVLIGNIELLNGDADDLILQTVEDKGLLDRLGATPRELIRTIRLLDYYNFGPFKKGHVGRVVSFVNNPFQNRFSVYKYKIIRHMAQSGGTVDTSGLPKKPSSDKAQVGGIDLSASERIAMDGDDTRLFTDLSPDEFARMDQEISGLVPFIIAVQPVTQIQNFMNDPVR